MKVISTPQVLEREFYLLALICSCSLPYISSTEMKQRHAEILNGGKLSAHAASQNSRGLKYCTHSRSVQPKVFCCFFLNIYY